MSQRHQDFAKYNHHVFHNSLIFRKILRVSRELNEGIANDRRVRVKGDKLKTSTGRVSSSDPDGAVTKSSTDIRVEPDELKFARPRVR